MHSLKNQVATTWEKLNPSEPSPLFLVKLMAFMLSCFAFGLIVGHYT